MNLGLATREATCLGPIGLVETRGNGYIVSDTLLKSERERERRYGLQRFCIPLRLRGEGATMRPVVDLVT